MEMEFDKTVLDLVKEKLQFFTLSYEIDSSMGKDETSVKLITGKGILRFKSIDAMVKALDLLVL